MELAINGGGSCKVSEQVFGTEYNESLVHQIVTAYLAGGRRGTKAQKTRSDARGGGAKPWRQKGTGRARAGTSRSPIWVGGGRTFAARPRDFTQKVNKKMYRGAMRSILSELVRQERMTLIEKVEVAAPKTKELLAMLAKLKLKNVLIVVEKGNDNLFLAARNLHYVDVLEADEVNPVSLINFDHVLLEKSAIKVLEGRLQ